MRICLRTILPVVLVLAVFQSNQAFAASSCPALAKRAHECLTIQKMPAKPGRKAVNTCSKLLKKFKKSCAVKIKRPALCLLNVDPVCAIKAADLSIMTYSNSCNARYQRGAWPVYKGICN